MANKYTIHLYDHDNGTKTAVIEDFASLSVVRTVQGTEAVEIQFSADAENAKRFQHGQVFRVHEPRWVSPATGAITGRDICSAMVAGPVDYAEDQLVTVRAAGMIARLADNVFPPEYLLTGTLQSNRTRFVRRHDSRTITADGWEAGTDTMPVGKWNDEILAWNLPNPGGSVFQNTKVDSRESTGEDYDSGGYVTLSDDASPGTYQTPHIDFVTAPGAWDRLWFDGGWQNRSDDPGEEVLYRVTSVPALGTAFSFSGAALEPGLDVAGLGIDVSGVTVNRYFGVEFQMASFWAGTNQPPYVDYLMVNAVRVETNFTVQLADWPTAVDFTLAPRDVGGMSVIEALSAICDSHGYEYRLTDPNTGDGTTNHLLQVQLIPDPGAVGTVWGTDRTNQYALVDAKHCIFTRLSVDDSDLCNYVEAVGTGAGRNASRVVVQDSPSQSAYGVRVRRYQTSKQTIPELLDAARAYIAFYKEPLVSLEVEVYDTPDGTMNWAPGDLIRVMSPQRNIARSASLSALEEYVLGKFGLEMFTLSQLEGLGSHQLFRESMRIMREERRLGPEGDVIRLTLENKPRGIIEQFDLRMAQLEENTRQSVKAHRSGVDVIGQFSDALVHTDTVHLDFTPDDAEAHILEIIDENGNGSTQFGGVVEVVIPTPVRLGQDKIEIDVQRTAVAGGYTGTYSVRLAWTATGREPLAEKLTRLRRG